MVDKVVVGYGSAASIHSETYPEARIIGIVDTDTQKRKDAEKLNIPFFKSLDDVFSQGLNPAYFDITTPTETHFEYVRKTLSRKPDARILVEKPVCTPSETEKMKRLQEKSKNSLITVCENYMSSNVSQNIKRYVKACGLKKPEISIEFSKNRIPVVEAGRFLDKELGALGYEGPHMLACVYNMGKGKEIKRIERAVLSPMKTHDAILENQGEAEAYYKAKDGSHVRMFTSMIGKRKFKLPPNKMLPKYNIEKNPDERFRVMLVREGDTCIGGIYEPIPNQPRNTGILFKSENNIIKDFVHVVDNSMRTHQERTIKFFEGEAENPCDVKTATNIVEDLDKLIKHTK